MWINVILPVRNIQCGDTYLHRVLRNFLSPLDHLPIWASKVHQKKKTTCLNDIFTLIYPKRKRVSFFCIESHMSAIHF